jgi:hypothetical protein
MRDIDHFKRNIEKLSANDSGFKAELRLCKIKNLSKIPENK